MDKALATIIVSFLAGIVLALVAALTAFYGGAYWFLATMVSTVFTLVVAKFLYDAITVDRIKITVDIKH